MNTSLFNDSMGNHSTSVGPSMVWDQWGWWTKQILTPVIVLVGITGNVLSFCLMKSQSLRNKSYSHYLCALAVFDSLTLIGRELVLLNEMARYLGSSGLFVPFNDATCKMYNFCEHVCYMMSSWLIVAMAFERIVAIYFPFKKRAICKPTVAIAVIAVTLLGSSYTQVFRVIMIVKDGTECVAAETHSITYVMLHTYFYQLSLTFILPVCIVVVCNGLVLSKVLKIRKNILVQNSSTSHRPHFHSHFYKTTVTLLTISFVYVLCTLPMVVVTLMFLVVWNQRGLESVSFLYALKPYGDAFEVLFVLNYGVNFFIYVFSGKIFRREFLHFVKCRGRSVYNSARTRESNIR